MNPLDMTADEWRKWHAKHTSKPVAGPIIEAAARAMEEFRQAFVVAVGDQSPFAKQALLRADAALAALPLIRAAALEEAARVAENVDRDVAGQSTFWSVGYFAQHIRDTADAIRALKTSGQPIPKT